MVPSDFPSVTYPWLAARERSGMRIRWVPDVAATDLTQSLADAISERTTVVCISAVQFSTGSQVDVAALVTRARSAGARVVVDVTQMAGAVPVTMSAWGADALVCSGYKWLSAPGGVALLAVTEDLAADHSAARGVERQRHSVRLQAAGTHPRRGRPAIRAVHHVL